MSNFLPPDYTTPAPNSRYLKFDEEKEYQFRILSDAIVGTQLWFDHKPSRRRLDNPFSPAEILKADKGINGQQTAPVPFMAFAVLFEGEIKILQISQVTIQREIEKLYRDEDWGDPKTYNIVVTRGKTGQRVSYTVTPKPKKELSADKMTLWKETVKEGFNLDALFTGGNPFGESTGATGVELDEVEAGETGDDDGF